MKWDKWGKSYRIKKGDNVVSLSDISRLNPDVDKDYSTVTDLSLLTTKYFITFIFRYKSSDFIYRKTLTESHQKLHNTIWKLKQEGLGYHKISKRLNEMGIKSFTGKSFYPSLIFGILKKIKVKEELMNKRVVKEYMDFDIVFVEKV